MTVFPDVPPLLESSYLAPKPFVLSRQFWILGRDYIRVALGSHPLVQSKQADPQIIRNLTL